MSIQIGSYVKFGGSAYVVTKLLANSTVQVLNPLGEGTQSKKAVSPANCEELSIPPMTQVEYRDASYLVSAKGLIISLTTARVMKWDESNGNRVAILALLA